MAINGNFARSGIEQTNWSAMKTPTADKQADKKPNVATTTKDVLPPQQISRSEIQLTDEAAKQLLSNLIGKNKVLTYNLVKDNGLKTYLTEKLGASFSDEKSFKSAVEQFQMASGKLIGSGTGSQAYADGLFGIKTLNYFNAGAKPEDGKTIAISSNTADKDIIKTELAKLDVPSDKTDKVATVISERIKGLADNQEIKIHQVFINAVIDDINHNYTVAELDELAFIDKIQQAKAERAEAEKYLGRTMTDKEWDFLVRATIAEASSNQEEQANIMAVILNRAKEGNQYSDNIARVLKERNQFQSVTGTPAERIISSNFVAPSNKQIEKALAAVTQYLPDIKHTHLNFTSNIEAAYGEGTNINFLYTMRKHGTVIGKTVFGTA